MRPPERLSRPEFVALMAMLFATIAFSIDSILPALPEVSSAFTPDAPNRAQLVITSFVLGMGIGTFFTGPLSDTFGRRPVIFAGAAVYIAGAALAAVAQSLEVLLAARVLQGLGAAGPRVVSLAIIRDLYSGRAMAQILSFVMLIFSVVPALAPAIGAVIITIAGWRAVFASFVIFSLVSLVWLMTRQRETLPPEQRRPFRAAHVIHGVRETLSHGEVVTAVAIQTLVFGMLFSLLSTIHPVMDEFFGRGDSFPAWFALIAAIASVGSVINAGIVMRLGMRRVATRALLLQIVASGIMVLSALVAPISNGWGFAIFLGWASYVFLMTSLTIGNLNALAMVPLGHLAGLAASVISSIATVGAVLIAVPIGLAFDGSPLPLAAGVLCCACAAWGMTRWLGDPLPEGA